MYDIRQFRPTLYLVALLGITGFCFGAEMPGLWLLSGLAIGLHMWLVKTGRFKPIPRFIANLATVGMLCWCVLAINSGLKEILAIGQFLVLMHVIKFYEQRMNRDFAQILVLSLLLMVAASITSVTLLFGLILCVYLLVALYCCLLFHLKSEADLATAAMKLDRPLPPHVLRQDQHRLSRSMRRVTALVAVVSITTAVIVFLLFPRGAGAGMFGSLRLGSKQALSGFSEQTSFAQIEQLQQNTEIVANLKLYQDGQLLQNPREIFLRGNVLDVYSGNDSVNGASWQWSRSPSLDQGTDAWSANEKTPALFGLHDASQMNWRQVIRLEPTGTQVLFGMGGISQLTPQGRDLRMRYAPVSQTLYSNDRLNRPIEYEVYSSGTLHEPAESIGDSESEPVGNYAPNPMRMGAPGYFQRPLRTVSNIDRRIAEYALRPDVSGADEKGPLASRRPYAARTTDLDEQIADNIQNHLRTQFLYSMNLTGMRTDVNEDPMVTFLYKSRKGYCGYFASSMTLMCQSLGIKARYVVGFKTGAEYSNLTGSYIVRQSEAHAWVEVLLPDGTWRTYDPTTGNSDDEQSSGSWWMPVQHLIDYLEQKWSDSVVNYDAETRQGMLNNVENHMSSGSNLSAGWLADMGQWARNQWLRSSQGVLGTLMGVLLLALALAVGWFLRERWRLKRVAQRIGLTELPAGERLRLARQLEFYDELVRLLKEKGLTRAMHQTPMEFTDSLTFLPADVYQSIRRLTAMFYRIRFGQRSIQPAQVRRLHQVIQRVQEAMFARPDRV